VTDSIRLSFPREPDSVPAARALLAEFEGRLGASALYDASLCLSELVTNAVQHPDETSGDELELALSMAESVLRVEVVDPGGGFRPAKPTEGDERGWGLYIVDQLSTRWGTEPSAERTVMWFEIVTDEGLRGAAASGGAAVGFEDGDPQEGRVANAVARLRMAPLIQ
jgi:anti-sigma regulatory factor (Ser/Thr protein kinase)